MVQHMCFSNNLHDILTDSWYNSREKSLKEEENRLIESAAELILR